jgi:hypothetical protein
MRIVLSSFRPVLAEPQSSNFSHSPFWAANSFNTMKARSVELTKSAPLSSSNALHYMQLSSSSKMLPNYDAAGSSSSSSAPCWKAKLIAARALVSELSFRNSDPDRILEVQLLLEKELSGLEKIWMETFSPNEPTTAKCCQDLFRSIMTTSPHEVSNDYADTLLLKVSTYENHLNEHILDFKSRALKRMDKIQMLTKSLYLNWWGLQCFVTDSFPLKDAAINEEAVLRNVLKAKSTLGLYATEVQNDFFANDILKVAKNFLDHCPTLSSAAFEQERVLDRLRILHNNASTIVGGEMTVLNQTLSEADKVLDNYEQLIRSEIIRLLHMSSIEQELVKIDSNLDRMSKLIDPYLHGNVSLPDPVLQAQDIITQAEATLRGSVSASLNELGDPPIGSTIPTSHLTQRSIVFAALYERLKLKFDTSTRNTKLLRPKVDLAFRVSVVWTELDNAARLIEARNAADAKLRRIPHGLDNDCSEEALNQAEQELASAEGIVSEWHKIMRKAKAEKALASLMEMNPSHALLSVVESRASGVLSDMEIIIARTRERWQLLANARRIMLEIARPGKFVVDSIQEVICEMNSVLKSTTIAFYNDIEATDEAFDDAVADAASQTKWLLDKLRFLESHVNRIGYFANEFADNRVSDYRDNLSHNLKEAQSQVFSRGVHAVQSILSSFETRHAITSENEFARLELILKEPVVVNEPLQSIHLVSAKYRQLLNDVNVFAPQLLKFKIAADRTAHIVHDWTTAIVTAEPNSSNLFSDRIRDRYGQVQSRIDEIDHTARVFYAICEEASDVASAIEGIYKALELWNASVTNAQSDKGAKLESWKSIVVEGDQQLLNCNGLLEQVSNRMRTLLENLTLQSGRDDTTVLSVCLSRLYESAINQLQTTSELYEVVRVKVNATNQYAERCHDLQSTLTANLAAINSIQQDLLKDSETLNIGDIRQGIILKSTVSSILRRCMNRESELSTYKECLAEIADKFSQLEASQRESLEDFAGLAHIIEAERLSLKDAEKHLTSSLELVQRTLYSRVKLFEYADDSIKLVQIEITSLGSRIEDGEGWSSVLAKGLEAVGDGGALEVSLDIFGKCVDQVVKGWEDELLTLEDKAEDLGRNGSDILDRCDLMERDVFAAIIKGMEILVCESLRPVQQSFTACTTGLFSLSGTLDKLLVIIAQLEVLIDGSISVLRRRMFNGGESPFDTVLQSRKESGHLIIHGNEAADSKNMLVWIHDQTEIERQIKSVIRPEMERMQKLYEEMQSKAKHHLFGASYVIVSSNARKKVLDLSSLFKELLHYESKEKEGLENARKFKQVRSLALGLMRSHY